MHGIFGNADHKVTGILGLVVLLSPATLDVIYKALGIVALAVSIYCSLARERRESRGRKP